ncbi:coiled-coil domain-containing protein 8 homolog [Cyclospora cayetanensis]|uniref:Coiled-coil domain-containing protein 8 homolog n=1 Tax=Cyclospora cayetanensis TaxID=88456 RepID=A0A6P6S1V8_9EIME|nr:coiled-coil domain-containing protein 8 homolog [Cyclospora cayetanensis]
MDVQSKINCSLDDLIKLQRKAAGGGGAKGPRGAATFTPPQKGSAPQRVVRKGGGIMKHVSKQRQLKQSPSAQQQQQRGAFDGRPQKQQQHQKSRNMSVSDKIGLPLDALVASRQKQVQKQPLSQEKKRRDLSGLGKRRGSALGARRGAFLASKADVRRGRLHAAVAAASAARSNQRSAASKLLAATVGMRRRARTPHQQAVETLKTAAGFKGASSRRNRSGSYASYPRGSAASRARLTAAAGSRWQLRRQSTAIAAAGPRANTSLARRRPLGAAVVTAAAAAAASSAARSSRGGFSAPSRLYRAPPFVASKSTTPIDRRRPSPSTTTPVAAPATAEAEPSFAADSELLANIKIMATLDTVPAPLPQQRGSHVAVPAAMQRQQQQQMQQMQQVQPSRAVGTAAADHGSLSTRFGY